MENEESQQTNESQEVSNRKCERKLWRISNLPNTSRELS